MIDLPTDEEFEQYVNDGFSAIPPLYMEKLHNVAIVIADEPTTHQREKIKLRCDQLLFGLYEGIPLTRRGVGSTPNLALPDKITIFKLPLVAVSKSVEELKENVRHTLWHEIAHFYGLDHTEIHKRENKQR